MRILIDTDVLLDLALDRAPHAAESARILQAVQRGSVSGLVAWHSISNLYYLLSGGRDRNKARQFIRDLSRILKVAVVDSDTLRIALSLHMRDFEDAMQAAAAVAGRADAIITRNVRDFRGSPIRATAPRDFDL